MNAVHANRLRAFDAAPVPNRFCGPLRMSGSGWSQAHSGLRGQAWRRAFGQKRIWGRSLAFGLFATLILGAIQGRNAMAGGLGCSTVALLAQCWQSADERSEKEHAGLN